GHRSSESRLRRQRHRRSSRADDRRSRRRRAARDHRVDVRPWDRRLHGPGLRHVLHALADRAWILFARRPFHRSMRFLFAVSLVACVQQAPQAVAITPLPVASQTIEPVVEVRTKKTSLDDGDFTSDKGGMIHLTAAADGSLSGSYTNGILTCTAALACLWYE